jgi:hypothetical protein
MGTLAKMECFGAVESKDEDTAIVELSLEMLDMVAGASMGCALV